MNTIFDFVYTLEVSQIEQILTVSSYAEALLIEARLVEEGIPCHLQAFNDPAFGSFWRREEGWGIILAPHEFRGQIEQICEDIRLTRGTSDD